MSEASTDTIEFKPNTNVIEKAVKGLNTDTGVADRITTSVRQLVKGRKVGGSEDAQADLAETLFRNSIKNSHADPHRVSKTLSGPFASALSRVTAGQSQFMDQLNASLSKELGKSVSLGNITNALTGLVPYDLSAPAKLIYPVRSPFRNMIPRVQGQGSSHEAKIVTSISGAFPGGLGTPGNRMAINEMGTTGAVSSFPTYGSGVLPPQGSQTLVDVNVPYKFFGLSENVSWLAQFSGQGFDDAAGLASLILLQEMMLLEERLLIGGTSTILATPAAPGIAIRAAGTGETAVTGGTTNYYVRTTALNYYGETVQSAVATVAVSAGVIDVTPSPVVGALAQNVYISTGGSEPAIGSRWLAVGSTGSTRVTIQGALPTSGSNPPASDTGTFSTLDYNGLIPIIAGSAAGASGSGYPTGVKGSYVNQSANDVLSVNAVDVANLAMYNAFLADPDDIWTSATDATSLAHSIGSSGTTANFRWALSQTDTTGVRAGAAVSEFVNASTHKVENIKVHPYLPQGTAMFMSWNLPAPVQNVNNVWELAMVQDYLTISWPVIDVTFRFSMFMYGALFSPAPQYCGLLQGLQKSASTPYS